MTRNQSGTQSEPRRAERRGSPSHHGRTHAVRPRLVWSGLLVMVGGALLAAAGMLGLTVVGPWWWTSLAGAAVFVVGALLGLRGGFFYDVAGGQHPGRIAADVRDDVELEGPDPLDKRADPDTTEHVRASQRAVDRLRAASPRPRSLRPLGGWLTTGAGAVLLLAQGAFADSPAGSTPTQRVVGAGVVLVLVGLRMSSATSLVGPPFVVVVAVVVLVAALLSGGQSDLALGLQVLAGVLALLGGACGLDRRYRSTR